MTVYESVTPRGGGAVVAGGLMVAVLAVSIATRPLIAIDETRYAAVALEMFQRGDWLVPHLNGEPYSHKPPLLFWLVLVGWKLFGVSELWARAVAPLAGLVALALIGRLARALWPDDARVPLWSPLVAAGSFLWAAYGSLFMFDTLLACGALLALLGVVHSVLRGRRRGALYLILGLAIGLLAKGPVILLHVLPAALTAPWWAPSQSRRHWTWWYLLLIGTIACAAALALLWAIPAGRAGGPEYEHAILYGQTAGRVARSFAHQRSVFWYLPLLPAVLLPWIVWPEAWRAVRALLGAPADNGVRFCAVWAAAGLLGFSLISGKQVHYLLPLIPAPALLLARGLSLRAAAPLTRPWPVAGLLALFAIAIAATAHPAIATRLFWWPHPPLRWYWFVAPLGVAAMLLGWQRGRSTRNSALHVIGASTVVLCCALLFAAGHVATIPYDTSAMAARVRRELAAGRRIATIGAYNGEYHFPARLENVHFESLAYEAAPAWLARHSGALVLTYDIGHTPPQSAGLVAQYPFRNGWITLSSTITQQADSLHAAVGTRERAQAPDR
jgi:4-amino-4-deoxy-L-arabinose transferase-like glycosyltransferase